MSSAYLPSASFVFLQVLPSMASDYASEKIKMGQLFLKNGEYRTFIEKNRSSLNRLDFKLVDKWTQIAENSQGSIQTGRWIQVVASGFRTIPLINILVPISSVIGLTASGVTRVIILSPALGNFTAAVFEHTDWKQAKEIISKANGYLSIVNMLGILALISSNRFIKEGLEAGLYFLGKLVGST